MFIRKGEIFFSQRDLWNFDQALAKVIYAGLVQFKANCHYQSAPKGFIDTLPFAHDNIQTAWQQALDQMIYAFSPQQDYTQIEAVFMQYETVYADNADLQLSEHFSVQVVAKPMQGFNDQDIAAYQQRKIAWYAKDAEKRRQGILLFISYFQHVWQI